MSAEQHTGSPTVRLGLSTREHDVLRLIAADLSNAEIAAALRVSIVTVKTHVRSVYSCLGVRRRIEAVAWCADHGIEVGPHASLEDIR